MKVKAKKIVIAGILVVSALVLGATLKGNKQMPQTIEEELYAAYTTTIGSTTVDITQLVTSTPNAPELSAGMIPIKYTGTFWTITTADDPEWYNYNTGKPAYIMLNDGVYQSELKPNMTNKKLAQTGIELNTSNMGTICLWVPRFAYNSSGTIIYMKPESSVIGTWTIPTMFKYEVNDLTKRDYSLTGVWLEYNTGTTSVTTMTQENSKYGFLANVKAEKLASDAGISYYNTYLTNKGGTTPIKNPTYTTRRILKVINEQYSEPLKGKATYSSTSKAITVTTTYNKNSIAKILDMNGKQLSANSTTATTGDQTLGDATYTFTIIDVKGNAKQVQVTVSGTGVIMIATATDLINLRNNVNNGNTYSGKQILQIADVTLSGSWTPIGLYTSASNNAPFQGIYDGGGYSISGITGVSTTTGKYRGLFGYLGAGGTIKNVTLKNATVSGDCYIGGIVGYTTTGTITNCVNEAIVYGSSTTGGIGGIVGYIKGSGATITGCTNKNSVWNDANSSGYGECGGIVGYIDGSVTIRNCTNNGNVHSNTNTGGIVGYVTGSLTLSGCTNKNLIKSNATVAGGMVGYYTGDTAEFYNCVNSGEVLATQYAGGIVGDIATSSSSTSIVKCTNNGYIHTTSASYCGGIVGQSSGGTRRIYHCTNNGKVYTYANYAGGIVGQMVSQSSDYSQYIQNCINNGSVSGDQHIGGICGLAQNYTYIEKCGNKTTITGSGNNAGGICGSFSTYSSTGIRACYNTGAIKGEYNTGGIAGYGTQVPITYCYNTGTISVTSTNSTYKKRIGAIIGYTNKVSSSNYCLTAYTQDTTNISSTSSFATVVTATTLKALPSTLSSYFVKDTKVINAGYPVFNWQAVSTTIYAKLYTDGTLVIGTSNTPIEGKEVLVDYGDIYGAVFTNVYDVPWYPDKTKITKVNIANKIQLTSGAYLFYNCTKLKTIENISNLDTSKMTSMYYMFYYCSGLTSLDLSSFNTANVTNMSYMFYYCSGLTSLDLTSFNTSKVTTMQQMFSGCSSLTSLDLTSFNTSKVTTMSYMFYRCSNVTTIYVSSSWKTASNNSNMFNSCGTSTVTVV